MHRLDWKLIRTRSLTYITLIALFAGLNADLVNPVSHWLEGVAEDEVHTVSVDSSQGIQKKTHFREFCGLAKHKGMWIEEISNTTCCSAMG